MRDIQIFGQYFDLSLTCSVKAQLQTYFPTGPASLSDIVFHCRAPPPLYKTGCINVWGGIFRCSGGPLRFLILRAGQEMSHNCDRRFNWGSILVLETHLTHTICPQMWKYACSVKVIDESTGSRSGDASLEFAQCCSLVSECPTNYCN